jgi:hypothetical protein
MVRMRANDEGSKDEEQPLNQFPKKIQQEKQPRVRMAISAKCASPVANQRRRPSRPLRLCKVVELGPCRSWKPIRLLEQLSHLSDSDANT